MSELSADAEQALAAMTEFEVTDLLARLRPRVESQDPMIRADQALRRSRGLARATKGTPESAAAAVREYARGSRTN
jgi:hypothetical protein